MILHKNLITKNMHTNYDYSVKCAAIMCLLKYGLIKDNEKNIYFFEESYNEDGYPRKLAKDTGLYLIDDFKTEILDTILPPAYLVNDKFAEDVAGYIPTIKKYKIEKHYEALENPNLQNNFNELIHFLNEYNSSIKTELAMEYTLGKGL